VALKYFRFFCEADAVDGLISMTLNRLYFKYLSIKSYRHIFVGLRVKIIETQR